MVFKRFNDRIHAGQVLAASLSAFAHKKNAIILALPRGGVPVAHEVAKALELPMDVWLVRKLGVPGQEELAMGAVSLGDICHVDANIVTRLDIPTPLIQRAIEKERLELDRRNKLYRQGKPLPDLKRKTVIVIDDGLATGATMHAAVLSLREAHAHRIIVAIPVGAASSCSNIEDIADEVICVHRPEPFHSVGQWYKDFTQTEDDEVLEILNPKKKALA